jgi:hypothetical protein
VTKTPEKNRERVDLAAPASTYQLGERVQPVETNRKPGSELNTARRYYDAIHDVDDPEGL